MAVSRLNGTATVDLDLFKPTASALGGCIMLGKMKIAAGEYEVHVPENFGLGV